MDPVIAWLRELTADLKRMPLVESSKPYWSQRPLATPVTPASWGTTVRRVRALVRELETDHFFAERLGFDCVDGNGESPFTAEIEFEQRVGKPQLLTKPDGEWEEADLCDFIEVFHDLAARPTTGWFHQYCG